MRGMRELLAALAFLITLAIVPDARCIAQGTDSGLDSGVVGVVPHYAEDLASMEDQVKYLKKELAGRSDKDQLAQLPAAISVDNIRGRCVQAFDPASELPIAYSSRGGPAIFVFPAREPEPAAGLPTRLISCADADRFPRNFTKLVANTTCGDNGVFRLPLAPGRYAVFVGWPVVGHSLSTNPWWQFVEVKPHEWEQLIPPKNGVYTSCNQDSDCAKGLVCGSPFGRTDRTCQVRPQSLPRLNSSGVAGFVGTAICADSESQCVEAFSDPGDYMTACGMCAWDGAFKLPLAPGHYTLEFVGWHTSRKRQTLTVEVSPNRWEDLYLLGATKNQPPPRCSPHS